MKIQLKTISALVLTLPSIACFSIPKNSTTEVNTNIVTKDSTNLLKKGVKNTPQKGNFYVLGDSLSDTGNLANIVNHYDPFSWFHTFTFPKPFYKNHWTDGKVAAEVAANDLGQQLIPAWYSHGNNYAVAAAMAGHPLYLSQYSWEYGLFYNYIMNKYSILAQAQQLVKDHKLNNNDEIFIEIGANDIIDIASYYTNTLQENVEISNSVASEINAIEYLANNGAKNIIIGNLPDVSKTPEFANNASLRTLAHNLVVQYNNKLSEGLNAIKTFLKPQTRLLNFDLYDTFYQVLNTAQQIGMNTTVNAVNSSLEKEAFNIALGYPTKFSPGVNIHNMDNYFFFDFLHPTKWGHQLIGNILYDFIKSSILD